MKLQSQPAIQQHDEADYWSYKVNDQGTTDEEKKTVCQESSRTDDETACWRILAHYVNLKIQNRSAMDAALTHWTGTVKFFIAETLNWKI